MAKLEGLCCYVVSVNCTSDGRGSDDDDDGADSMRNGTFLVPFSQRASTLSC